MPRTRGQRASGRTRVPQSAIARSRPPPGTLLRPAQAGTWASTPAMSRDRHGKPSPQLAAAASMVLGGSTEPTVEGLTREGIAAFPCRAGEVPVVSRGQGADEQQVARVDAMSDQVVLDLGRGLLGANGPDGPVDVHHIVGVSSDELDEPHDGCVVAVFSAKSVDDQVGLLHPGTI